MNINYKLIPLERLHIQVERILFGTKTGVNEIHVMLHLTPDFPTDADPIEALLEAKNVIEMFLRARTLHGRMFLAEGVLPAPGILDEIAVIGQTPLDGTAAAMWLWMVQGEQNAAYQHTFSYNNAAPDTLPLLAHYKNELESRGLRMKEHCLRTWFFVRDIDQNYAELVKTRRDFFEQEGMTPQTHYISSTGINGNPLCADDNVQLETYTIEGLQPQQIQFLKGRSHLNPTAEYGVTFERGTRIEYADRCHLLISGTASIDNTGAILYPEDPEKQVFRMLENIQVLLNEGGASIRDLMHGIVYIRRKEDYSIIRKTVEQILPDLPKVFLLAPVCRPGWLVEMEGIAVIPNENADIPSF